MPRDGSGIYTYPAGTPGVTATTISSAKYNGYIDDVQADLNAARPVVAGGTGANNAPSARSNLAAEVRLVQVTNYDSHVFEPGSFWSDNSATGGPVTPAAYASGVCHMINATSIVIEVHVYTQGTAAPPRRFTREKWTTWGAWMAEGQIVTSDGVGSAAATGDMWYGVRGTSPTSKFVVNSESDLTGTDLFTVSKPGGIFQMNGIASGHVQLIINKQTSGFVSGVATQTAGVSRWTIHMGDNTAESGSNAGSDFGVFAHSDGGAVITNALAIKRADGRVTFGGNGTATDVRFDSPRAGALNYGFRCNASLVGDFALTQGTAFGSDPFAGNTIFHVTPGGYIKFPNTAVTSSPTTGAVVISGGLGVGGSVRAGGVLQAGTEGHIGANTADGVIRFGSAATAYYYFDGTNTTSYGGTFNTSTINVSSGTPSTTHTNGALVVAGGIGCGGEIHTYSAIYCGSGYRTKAGTSGLFSNFHFNLEWKPGPANYMELWVDAVNLGQITTTSDYRTKKDVRPLSRTWDTVKALRPISYSHADYGTLFKADDTERWGFIAHELQETLIESAATGTKDAENLVQSPNPWTVIAALTKALQEAMTRIEALEAGA